MASKSRAEGAVEFALPRANAGEHLRRKGQDAGTGNLQKANGRQKVLGGTVERERVIAMEIPSGYGKYMVIYWKNV